MSLLGPVQTSLPNSAPPSDGGSPLGSLSGIFRDGIQGVLAIKTLEAQQEIERIKASASPAVHPNPDVGVSHEGANLTQRDQGQQGSGVKPPYMKYAAIGGAVFVGLFAASMLKPKRGG